MNSKSKSRAGVKTIAAMLISFSLCAICDDFAGNEKAQPILSTDMVFAVCSGAAEKAIEQRNVKSAKEGPTGDVLKVAVAVESNNTEKANEQRALKSPETIVIVGTTSLEKKAESNRSQFNYGLFVDGTAAIFGILAVVIALLVLVLALRGRSEFDKILSDLKNNATKDLSDKIGEIADSYAKNKLMPDMERLFIEKRDATTKSFDEYVVSELGHAKTNLHAEIKTLITSEELFKEIVEVTVAEVERRLSPSAPASMPGEFEPAAEEEPAHA